MQAWRQDKAEPASIRQTSEVNLELFDASAYVLGQSDDFSMAASLRHLGRAGTGVIEVVADFDAQMFGKVGYARLFGAGSGGDPALVNPLVPASLVIDHSVQIDRFGSAEAFAFNVPKEYERNVELYQLLRDLFADTAAILFYTTDYDELIGCCE